MFDPSVSDDALRLLERMLVFSGHAEGMSRRPQQTHHREGGAGVRVSEVHSEAGDGDCHAHAHAIPIRVRLRQRRGGKASAPQAYLPGGHAVPVGETDRGHV